MIDDIMGFIKYCQQTAKQLRLLQQHQQKLSKNINRIKLNYIVNEFIVFMVSPLCVCGQRDE